MTRILFLRSLPLAQDARSSKMIAEYRRRGHHVTSVVWGRGQAVRADDETVVCDISGGYGRRWRGLIGRIKWMLFLAAWMIRQRRSYDVVHVVDLDTGIVGAPLALLMRKPFVYDAFDHINAIAGGGIAAGILARIERLAINQSSIAVFPDPVRLEQYGVSPNERVKIIGNIPDVRSVPEQQSRKAAGAPLEIVYVGTLEAVHRGLEFLPPLCVKCGAGVRVTVAGTGELDSFFEEAAKSVANLLYLAQQDYPTALLLMAEADCLYGPYLLSAPAHRYASPNKMYEHLALGKPLITSAGTPPAELVSHLGSGFLFDGTLEGLYRLMGELDRATCREAGQRAADAWRDRFSSMRDAQLESYFHLFDRLALVPAT